MKSLVHQTVVAQNKPTDECLFQRFSNPLITFFANSDMIWAPWQGANDIWNPIIKAESCWVDMLEKWVMFDVGYQIEMTSGWDCGGEGWRKPPY